MIPAVQSLLVDPENPYAYDDETYLLVKEVPAGGMCPECGSLDLKDKGTFDKCLNCGCRFGYVLFDDTQVDDAVEDGLDILKRHRLDGVSDG